jgi:putative membrane protein
MKRQLSEADHAKVSAAVTAAEAKTAGEIVTVVTDRSDGYTDVALVWAAIAAFTAIAFLTFFPGFYLGLVDRILGKWNADWTPRGIFGLALLVGILKFAGAWLIQLWQPLKFLLIPGVIKSHRANARAVAIFKVGAQRRTTGRTGILIYLSMRERRAEIVADEAITSKVAAETWGEAMAAMLAEVKQGRVAEGMVAAVEKVGAVLAEHFPRDEHDVNELPDQLIEL